MKDAQILNISVPFFYSEKFLTNTHPEYYL
jgi:hypothetical protein